MTPSAFRTAGSRRRPFAWRMLNVPAANPLPHARPPGGDVCLVGQPSQPPPGCSSTVASWAAKPDGGSCGSSSPTSLSSTALAFKVRKVCGSRFSSRSLSLDTRS